jgi:hypothetical protein
MLYHTWDIRSDEEREKQITFCHNNRPHTWGIWMHLTGGKCRDFRRFCSGCNGEQRGTGTINADNVQVWYDSTQERR